MEHGSHGLNGFSRIFSLRSLRLSGEKISRGFTQKNKKQIRAEKFLNLTLSLLD